MGRWARLCGFSVPKAAALMDRIERDVLPGDVETVGRFVGSWESRCNMLAVTVGVAMVYSLCGCREGNLMRVAFDEIGMC